MSSHFYPRVANTLRNIFKWLNKKGKTTMKSSNGVWTELFYLTTMEINGSFFKRELKAHIMHFHAEYRKTLRSGILNVNDSGTHLLWHQI